MTFITGTVTNANPGPTLYALIETPALAAGWTLDDTVVIGGNTHKVLKSAAAGNTYGLDWYLDINYPTTGITGGMRFTPFEGYTAASDVGLRGPYSAANAVLDATTYSRFGATTSALETNWANSASYTALSATLSTSTFTYWITITRDRIIVMTSLQATQVSYAGFFTPTSAHSSNAGAALFPLVTATVTANSASTSSTTPSSVTMAFTRTPKLTSIPSWGSSAYATAQAGVLGFFGSGQAGVAASEITGASQLVPVPILMGVGVTPGVGSTLSALAGYFDGVAAGYVLSSAVRGDSLTVGSDTWYAATPSGSYGLFFKGA